jgi:hypothetical protein
MPAGGLRSSMRSTHPGPEIARYPPSMATRFRPGEGIALREVWQDRVFEARPTIVVKDEVDQTMLLLPAGVRCGVPVDDQGRDLRIPDRAWHLEVRSRGPQPILSFAWPELPYSVLLWTAHGRRVWYVNLQDPLTRTSFGFDTVDHALDVLIELDGSGWAWKDEDELQLAVARGLFSEHEAAEFRRWGEVATEHVLAPSPPFDRDWTAWQPDPSWRSPELPDGWDAPPGSV